MNNLTAIKKKQATNENNFPKRITIKIKVYTIGSPNIKGEDNTNLMQTYTISSKEHMKNKYFQIYVTWLKF